MTLTATQIADGWKPHDGGECPVDPQCKVQVMFRDGEIRKARRAEWWTAFDTVTGFADHDLWKHQAPSRSNDIIAYKEQSHAADE